MTVMFLPDPERTSFVGWDRGCMILSRLCVDMILSRSCVDMILSRSCVDMILSPSCVLEQHVYTGVHTCRFSQFVCFCGRKCVCMCLCVCVWDIPYACIFGVYVMFPSDWRTHTHTYIHTYMHIYITSSGKIFSSSHTLHFQHKYIHTYIHTYTHTYIHACIPAPA